MSTVADVYIAALRDSHVALAELAGPLDLAGATHSSGASEWTVAQVLSHLGSGAEIMRAGLVRATTGVDESEPGAPQSIWDRWNAKAPLDQVADFITADDEFVALLEGLDDSARSDLIVDAGFAQLDVASFAAMRLNEVALHSWDVMVGFDPSATMPTSQAELLIDRAGFLLGFIGHPEALDGVEGTLAVRTSEPDRRIGLSVGSALSLTDEPTAPDGVLAAPAEAWLRLVSGRLKPEYTPTSVTVAGDLVTLEDLRRVFPGY